MVNRNVGKNLKGGREAQKGPWRGRRNISVWVGVKGGTTVGILRSR